MHSPYLKLYDVKKYYCQVAEYFNAEFFSVNSTRLKKRLLQLKTNLQTKKSFYIMELFVALVNGC